ncbi:hypothetical protein VIGAN_01148100 [Vigna angularis var. angularis]|uniref:Uncharacterized protein n=1 Tax=Vigna angularis var. angularis TaxID=157739 RepID=A0A0S3R004_PHAAN|nr:hypothetical protein VIGAN_01148100 [Vigna angularis var. angularis]
MEAKDEREISNWGTNTNLSVTKLETNSSNTSKCLSQATYRRSNTLAKLNQHTPSVMLSKAFGNLVVPTAENPSIMFRR